MSLSLHHPFSHGDKFPKRYFLRDKKKMNGDGGVGGDGGGGNAAAAVTVVIVTTTARSLARFIPFCCCFSWKICAFASNIDDHNADIKVKVFLCSQQK